jgi:adenosylcobinamide-GDP ribazoletransferase
VLGVGLVSVGSVRWLRRRLGGYVGDTLGAVQQVAELVCLLAWSHHGLGGHV